MLVPFSQDKATKLYETEGGYLWEISSVRILGAFILKIFEIDREQSLGTKQHLFYDRDYEIDVQEKSSILSLTASAFRIDLNCFTIAERSPEENNFITMSSLNPTIIIA